MENKKLFGNAISFFSLIMIILSFFYIARACFIVLSSSDRNLNIVYIFRNISSIMFFLGVILFYRFYEFRKLLYLGYLFLFINICIIIILITSVNITLIIQAIASLYIFYKINKYLYIINDKMYLILISNVVFFNENFKYNLAWIYYNEENYIKSIKIIKKCINNKSCYLLANNYEKINEYDKAIEMYTKILQNETIERSDILYNRGSIYKNMGKYKEAIDDFNSCIECKEPDVKAYIALGVIMDELGKYEEAKTLFFKGNTLDNSFNEYIPEKYK